jgi:putative oxidoreductase
MRHLKQLIAWYYTAARWPEYLAPVFDLILRLWLASAFFKSGLTKIKNWDSTLYLFSDVYQVPLLNPEFAAYLATSAELGLPVLLVIGLFTRFAAAGLFILNGVAVISYYSELSEAGLMQHFSWGLGFLVLLILSRSTLAVDTWLAQCGIKNRSSFCKPYSPTESSSRKLNVGFLLVKGDCYEHPQKIVIAAGSFATPCFGSRAG